MAKRKSSGNRNSTPQLDLNLPIYQVKISLNGIDPSIWRRIETKDCTLKDLHGLIQVSMGWEFAHIYAFEVGGQEYFDAEYGGTEGHDARATRLSDLARQSRLRLTYVYDFGDDWEHEVVIETTRQAQPEARYPRCVEGARACPPEDCGGAYDYPNLLAVLQDPDHEEHEDACEMVGESFDPEAFDLAGTNRALREYGT